MKYVYNFEKLQVWVESKEVTKSIYKITQEFPKNEKFGITSQLRRVSISICSNIAEGVSRYTNKDKARFITITFSSAVEVVNQLIISCELQFITQKQYESLRFQLESITNKLNALRNYLIKPQTNK
ncbi:MAG: four helix bundle protein [Kordia sp.]|uniref:four helix bundle protein n=1 Tax=Kordia sp. TaxID=1965332 RepID=UPI00385F7FF2